LLAVLHGHFTWLLLNISIFFQDKFSPHPARFALNIGGWTITKSL